MKAIGSTKTLVLASLSFVLTAVACLSDHTSPVEPAGPSFSAPIAITVGQTIGQATYASGDGSAGGQGGDVQGVTCDTAAPVVHVHAHLTLIADSVQRAIPMAVGTPDPFVLDNIGIAARCFYWLHTHGATGSP